MSQLQLQLNLTSGPKKSALEMLRKKIEAKNEQVVAARQKFLVAQKVHAKLAVLTQLYAGVCMLWHYHMMPVLLSASAIDA